MEKKLLISSLLIFLSYSLSAQNPIIKNIGMSDPHVRVFNDTIFLYTGKDADSTAYTWVMPYWQIFSSTDLVNWEKRGIIHPRDNYMDDNSTDCWAGDAETRNGKYYFYFSDRKRGVGVMQSDKPTGPFKDALGKPLVSPMHDPTILIDDDENRTPYIVYGDKEGGGFHVARLNDDMISIAEEPRPIEIIGEEWENAPKWMDKNYIFKHDGTYYLSWGRDYAVSDNIYGPYTCVGPVGEGHNLDELAHGSFFWWKGQFYHMWCYYIGRRHTRFRESIISYCHFDDDGNIVTDTEFLDKHFEYGVARYQASWDKIQAQWYYEISSPEIQKRGNRADGFRLTGISNDHWISFSNVDFEVATEAFTANIKHAGKGSVEVRINDVKGERLGTIELSTSKGSEQFKQQTSKIRSIKGEHDVYLVFKGDAGFYVELDWIQFK